MLHLVAFITVKRCIVWIFIFEYYVMQPAKLIFPVLGESDIPDSLKVLYYHVFQIESRSLNLKLALSKWGPSLLNTNARLIVSVWWNNWATTNHQINFQTTAWFTAVPTSEHQNQIMWCFILLFSQILYVSLWWAELST